MVTNIENMLTLTEAAELAGRKRQTIHEALTSDPPRVKGRFIKGRWYLTRREVDRVWRNKKKKK